MKRKDPLQLFKFHFSKLSCICNFFLSLVIRDGYRLIFNRIIIISAKIIILFFSNISLLFISNSKTEKKSTFLVPDNINFMSLITKAYFAIFANFRNFSCNFEQFLTIQNVKLIFDVIFQILLVQFLQFFAFFAIFAHFNH